MTGLVGMLGAVTATSLAGSVHCVAMCGPLVGLWQDPSARGRRALTPHLAHAGGRAVAYAVLGALAGAIGGAVDLAGGLFEVQRVAWLIAAAVVTTWGVVTLLAALGVGAGRGPRVAAAPVLLRIRRRRRPTTRAALVGLLSAALPCGWLWAFVVLAAGTGGAATGAAVMFAFWLGTVPMMLGAGALLSPLVRRLGRRWPLVSAAALIGLGSAALVLRAPMAAPVAPDHPTATVPTGADCPLHHHGH